ncbi:conserved hypothetical protein, partial [Trichinella spiralis]
MLVRLAVIFSTHGIFSTAFQIFELQLKNLFNSTLSTGEQSFAFLMSRVSRFVILAGRCTYNSKTNLANNLTQPIKHNQVHHFYKFHVNAEQNMLLITSSWIFQRFYLYQRLLTLLPTVLLP